MTISRWIAGLSLLASLAVPAGGAVSTCADSSAPAGCGCPAPESSGGGRALTAPCCCGCEAPESPAPRPWKETPARPVPEDGPKASGAQAAVAVACLEAPADFPLVALAPRATPPLFLLHRALRN
jgi:hypothetical protein